MRLDARSSEPLARLVRFDAADGVTLSALLYEPKHATQRVIVWLHGTGGASVFDSNRTNRLAHVFVDRGVAFFPFNNRGARGGMTYEVIRDCVPDLDGAIRELWSRGFRDITLAGHSTGANKIAVYDHRKPRNRARRYVFVAPGDDTGLLYASLGARRYQAALKKAQAMIKVKRGNELVPPAVSPMTLSWRSFYDMANANGDYNVFPFLESTSGSRLSRRPLFRHLRTIRKPSLYVIGECDEYTDDAGAAAGAIAQHVGERAEVVVMGDADHGFHKKESDLATLIADWAESLT